MSDYASNLEQREQSELLDLEQLCADCGHARKFHNARDLYRNQFCDVEVERRIYQGGIPADVVTYCDCREFIPEEPGE